MFIKSVLEKKVKDIVNNSKSKMSTDHNDLDMKIVKAAIKGFSGPLTHICNLSFQTGQFPYKMKIAKVIPLYESGNQHLFTNYRPVSLLPQFSKILEKLFAERLNNFLEHHKLLTDTASELTVQ